VKLEVYITNQPIKRLFYRSTDMLPDLFRRMKARRNFVETQQSVYANSWTQKVTLFGLSASTYSVMLKLWYLLIYLSTYLDQETAKETFWSSNQAATCYY